MVADLKGRLHKVYQGRLQTRITIEAEQQKGPARKPFSLFMNGLETRGKPQSLKNTGNQVIVSFDFVSTAN